MTDEKKPPQGAACLGGGALTGQLEPAGARTVFTGESRLLDADGAEGGVRAIASAAQPGAAAGIAAMRGMGIGQRLRRATAICKCHVCLAYFRLRRLELGFYIVVRSLQCRLLGLQEPKMLAKNRRTAVLVDKFFKMVDEAHKSNR